jgi:hypothetical protein
MLKEYWRPVVGLEGRYEVSTLGRVMNSKTGKILNPVIRNKYGYLSVCLSKQMKYIHRLMAEAFIPNPENKPSVDHIDGNPQNNCVDNLRWCT